MEPLRERIKRLLTFATGLFECICFSGVLFGWASLVFVLKKEKYFTDLCDPVQNSSHHGVENGTMHCDPQDERFTLLFTLGSFMNNFVTLPCGFMFDRFGTMATRFFGIFLYTTATLMIAFSHADTAVLLFPAVCLLAVGGILFLLTNMQVGNLFGRRRSTVITLYNGAFDSSSIVFLVVKVVYEAGLSLRNVFLFISCLSSIHIARTYVLLPRSHIPYPLPDGYTYGMQCEGSGILTFRQAVETSSRVESPKEGEGTEGEKDEQRDETEGGKAEGQELPETTEGASLLDPSPKGPETSEEAIPSFKSCIFSRLFLTHLLWLSIVQLRHYLFIGMLNPLLTLLARSDTQLISTYTNAFAFTQFFGVFCAPWNGLLLDRHKRKAKPTETASSGSLALQRLIDLKATVLSLTITVTQCVLFSLSAAIPVLPVQFLTFILQVINRAFLYGGHASFVAIGFPSCHFGKVFGTLMALSAVFSLLQYPCFALVKGPLQDDPMYLNIAFVILVTLAYVHPVNVFLYCRQEMRQREALKPPQVEVPILEKIDQPRETDI
ncbi:equilibrative nucleobase transporter 1-like [Chiloscyllium punctatum]|uniref:equilibrative nucleobase transporter 1-like n=1 Tax=Chiloscyllium punctatum TaxID=137246 RepID=UPI003B63FC87